MHQQLPSIRRVYLLEDLLTREELKPYSAKSKTGLIFLNLNFKEIWQDEHTPDLCDVISKARFGKRDCRACATQKNPPSSTEPVQETCVAGIRKIHAAVMVQDRPIGYVCGPQIPCSELYEHDLGELPVDTRQWLEKNRNVPPLDSSIIADEVRHVATRLSRRCTLERRLRILRDVRTRFVGAKDPDDVLDTAYRALEALFGGDIDICFYVLQEKGFLKLMGTRGPSVHAMPASLRPEQGHVGKVIRTREQYYQPDLDHDAEFIHADPNDRARSAFTVPFPWGPDEAPGALQAASKYKDHFPPYDRQAMLAVAEMAGLAAVKLSLKAAKLLAQDRNVAIDTWERIGLAVTATTTDRPVEILQAKRRLYAGLAAEALRVSPARAACIGIWDPRSQTVSVAATAGEGWNETTKSIFSDPGMRHAVRWAIDENYPYDIPNTTTETDRFKTILPFTQSLYIVPFKLKNELTGVLSLASPLINGFDDRSKDSVKNLIAQFEEVLAAIHTREDALFRRLSTDTDLQTLTRAAVDLIRRTFQVRGCSLFLKARERDHVELCATTGQMPEGKPHGYEFGVGLTGWVAQNRRPLRVWDTTDDAELDAISENLRPKIDKPWREEIAGGDSNRAFLAVPLIARDELVGVIRVKVKEDLSAFTHEDETSLMSVADRLAATIDNVWATEEAASKLRELESKAELQRAITEAESLQGVCQVLADEFMRNTEAIGAEIIIVDESPNYLMRLPVGAGLLKGFTFDDLTADAVLGINPKRLESLFEESIPDASEWSPIVDHVVEQFGRSSLATIVSAAIIPFYLDDAQKILAILLLCWHTPQRFDADRREQLQELRPRAVAALRPSALRRHTDKDLADRVEELAHIREIGLGFAQMQNLTLLMDQILDVSRNESKMERGSIRLLDDSKSALVLKAAHDIPHEVAPPILEVNDFFRRSLDSEGCVFVPDVSKDDLWRAFQCDVGTPERQAYMREVCSTLHVPIRLHGECVGLILLDSPQPRDVSERVLEYLEILGLYAAVAIDFARMSNELKEQIELAEPLAMVGTMLQGFLHVINNRLNDLFAILSNILDAPLEQRVRAKAINMRDQLERLDRVCIDLAFFARLHPVSVTEKVPLTDLVERALGDYDARLRDRQISVAKNLCTPSPVLIGNPVQIEIALKMLVQNALEAMQERGGELIVESSDGPAGARLSIRDTGPGMDASTKKQCMRPFFTTKGDNGGTGLGLPVVHGIMTRHKGKVDVQSEQGAGCTFTLLFPMREE